MEAMALAVRVMAQEVIMALVVQVLRAVEEAAAASKAVAVGQIPH